MESTQQDTIKIKFYCHNCRDEFIINKNNNEEKNLPNCIKCNGDFIEFVEENVNHPSLFRP
jgi:hypothetical protein